MKKHILIIVTLALILKIVYFLFAIGVSKHSTEYNIEFNKSEFLSLYKRNDSFWYQKAADEGYPKISNPLDLGYSYGKYYKQSVWAHFPCYPLCIRGVEILFEIDFNTSAFILSILFAISSFIGFYLVCFWMFELDEKFSLQLTLFFMVFPFHYYFSMYYTEAIFFTFLAFSFISIYKKLFWLTSILIIPLTLVRPNGMVCLIPLAIYLIEREGGLKQYFVYFKTYHWRKFLKLLIFITSPLALLVYCIYQKEMTGFYFAFIKAQAGWYKEFMFPLMGLFRRSDFTTQFNSIYTIVIMVISIFAAKKLPLSLNILIWINILLPMTSGSVACMPRYISIIFPLTIYMGSFVMNSRFRYISISLLLILQLIVFYPWLIYHPFSY